jgi:hypothetical protein
MRQPLLDSLTRSDEFSSPNPTRFLKQPRSLAPFRDIAFDFANTFKAFIGANYLAAPFAFSKAGWVLGTLILTTIAALTFHCCALIISCKRAAIDRINARTGEDRISIASRLQFPDIGREAFGQAGYLVVTAALGLSQAGFCIGYLIFMGITLKVLHSAYAFEINAIFSFVMLRSLLVAGAASRCLACCSFLYPSDPVAPLHFHGHGDSSFSTRPSSLFAFSFTLCFTDLLKVRRLAVISAIANASIICGFSSVLAIVLLGFSHGAPFQAEMFNPSWPFTMGYSFR